MRGPQRSVDYDIFNEGWVADCAYCDSQYASRRLRECERNIKAHIRDDHPEVLEGERNYSIRRGL